MKFEREKNSHGKQRLRRRDKPTHRWTTAETFSLLKAIADRLKKYPGAFEKPSAQTFYNTLCEKYKLDGLGNLGFNILRNKLRNLRKTYVGAEEWKLVTGVSLLEEGKEESVNEYVTRVCPNFDLLQEIFGQRYISSGILDSISQTYSDIDEDNQFDLHQSLLDSVINNTESDPLMQNNESDSSMTQNNESDSCTTQNNEAGPFDISEKIKIELKRQNNLLDAPPTQKNECGRFDTTEKMKIELERVKFEKQMQLYEKQMQLEENRLDLERKKLQLEIERLKADTEIKKLEIVKKYDFKRYELKLNFQRFAEKGN